MDSIKKESFWNSGYPGSEDRWTADLKKNHYDLIGEYVIDEKKVLLRFELDEDRRADIREEAPSFVNVEILVAEKKKEE